MRSRDILQTVLKADLCAGCGACAALAPESVRMRIDTKGFFRPAPLRKLTRTESRQIAAVCPGISQSGHPPEALSHLLWGTYLSVHQGWATDPDLRYEAASGGALSAVLVSLLDTGKVDAVLSIAADPDMPIGNKSVLTLNRDEILAQSASRYAPSKPLEDVRSLLDRPERFAFVGKPCDVAGLRNWARQDPRIDERFPVKLSFFCAGVPSLTGAKEMCRSIGIDPKNVSALRYRGRGWPGQATACATDGREASMRYQESWGDILSKHVQHRCRICADGIGLDADIAFADAWQCDAAGYPSFEEQPGRSAILVRTETGSRILERAISSEILETLPLPIESLTSMQPGQRRRREELLGRLAGKVMAGEPIPRYRSLKIWQNGLQAGLFRTAKACLGMARRRFTVRANQRSQS